MLLDLEEGSIEEVGEVGVQEEHAFFLHEEVVCCELLHYHEHSDLGVFYLGCFLDQELDHVEDEEDCVFFWNEFLRDFE